MFRRSPVIAASLLFFFPVFAEQPASAKQRPSILFLVTDDQGYGDLSCLGAKDIPTPNMDALAKRGILFTTFYAGAPICSPSRASLLTGRYPGMTGIRALVKSAPNVPGLYRDVPMAAELLKANGYSTFIAGKWHLGSSPGFRPWERGFDQSFGFLSGCIDLYTHYYRWGAAPFHDLWENGRETWRNGEFLTDLITAKALEELTRACSQSEPFFGYVAFNAPHYPLNAPSSYMDHFKSLKPERQWMAAMITAADTGIGRIVQLLKNKGRLDDTIIVFLSDNGPSRESRNFPDDSSGGKIYRGGRTGGLRGEKFSVFEGGIRVPGLISWPAGLQGDRRIDEPIMAMDILPTVLAACEIDPRGTQFDGVNLLSFLRGQTPAPKRQLFWENGGQTAARDGNWKLILHGQALGKKPDPVFLVDLNSDPFEKTNVAKDHPDIVDRLKTAAMAWRRDLDTVAAAHLKPNPPGKKNHDE